MSIKITYQTGGILRNYLSDNLERLVYRRLFQLPGGDGRIAGPVYDARAVCAVYRGMSAKTRAGQPVPPSNFSGANIPIAPVLGS